MHHQRLQKGFTLIELLVVIAIIGVLASVVLASLNSARVKARDAARKADLKQIQLALEFYYDQNNTYVVSGTGSNGGGNGWFNYQGTGYPKSVAQGLVDAGFLPGIVIDPNGNVTQQGSRSAYMIRASINNYTLYANLENPSAADTATLNNCYHTDYNGYNASVPVSGRINYCISN